jgi:Intracellular proteinase inhibitor
MICERSRAYKFVASRFVPPGFMNSRLIISLLCAGALAFACGPRSRSEPKSIGGALPVSLTSKTAERPKRRASSKPGPKINSKLQVEVAKKEVRFALNVTNVGAKHVELSFPTGKSYDFVVVDSIGREVWHWSNGHMFTQGLRNKQLGTGDTMQVDEAWTSPPQSGHYTAIATLNSSNFPVEQRVDFFIP